MTGAELKMARELAGKMQKEIAEKAGTDCARISRIEAGNADRMLKGFEKILNAYGYEIVFNGDAE